MPRRASLISIGAVLFLAACAAPPDAGSSASNPSTPPSAAETTTARSANGDTATITPRCPTRTDESQQELAKLTARTAGPNVASPSVDLRKRLVGMDLEAVQALLGEPDFERRDPPGRIWQYRTAGCILDVFLFDAASKMTVRHVETRGRTVSQPPDANCFDELLRRRASG